MAQNKTPRPLTAEELQGLREFKVKHDQKMATDPEYKASWEKMQQDLEKFFPIDREAD